MKNSALVRRFLALFLVAVMLAGLGAITASAEEAPFKIRLVLHHDMSEFPAADNEIEQLIEKYTNTDLDIVAYGTGYGTTVLPTLIASGDLPDVITIPQGDPPSFVMDMINAGMIWDIEQAVADSTYLSQNNPLFCNNLKIQGHLYGIPKIRALVRRVFMYRADWLDELGIPVPTTTDELYNALVTIKQEMPTTPDGATIYPLVIDRGSRPQIGIMFGAPNRWRRNDDGTFTRDAGTPEFMEAMKFMRKLYSEGLLHPDYAILDRNRDVWGSFAEGTAAVIRDSSQQIGPCAANVYKNFPDAKVSAFSLIKGTDGAIRTMGESGNNGYFIFTKAHYTDEADMRKMVNFFDQLGSKEISNLFTWGVEGKHYNIENGQIVPIPDMISDYNNNVRMAYRYTLAPITSDTNADPGIRTNEAQLEVDLDKAALQYVYPDDSYGLYSQTLAERNNLEMILEDAYLKFVTGQIDEAGYMAEYERWVAEGGDLIAKDYADYYAKYNQ